MVSSTSPLFDSSPARHPTPPKEVDSAVNEAITFLDDSNEIERHLKHQSSAIESFIDTPAPQSPSSSQDLPSGSKAVRKVGFSPSPTYHKVAHVGLQNPTSAQSLKPMRSERDARPAKSILKQSSVPSPPTSDDLDTSVRYFSPGIPGSFAKMLQSVTQQLASPNLTFRLDAYLTLNGALKSYEDVPDIAALASKLDLLMQFMTRDMVWKSENGALDVNIVTQALKLAGAILSHPKLCQFLDNDFRAFLVDRSMAVIENADIPNAIVKTHLFLLSQQSFNSSILTSSRADRIINSLQTIEERCSGNGAVASRLVIYQRLLEQTPATMLHRSRDWLEHVFHSMLSTVKDVRIRAIETCMRAGLVLGTQSSLSKALHEILETEVEEGQSYCEYLSFRLMQMTGDKELGAYVPQIWSAVILFFRSKRTPLEKWPSFKAWLMIIQKCLNSSDLIVRYQATLAWNKLVFAIMPGASISRNMMLMLKVPILAGLDKRGADQHSKQTRQYALDSYYNLLHYSLRPGLSQNEIESAWDLFVEPVLSEMVKSSSKGQYTACCVLDGLCSAGMGIWNINAANETRAIKAKELPRLDPRWIRSHLSKLLQLIQPALSSSMWRSEEETCVVNATVHSILQSVAEAGCQEVKTSKELKEAIALVLNMFRRLLNECGEPPPGTQRSTFIMRFSALLIATVQILGVSPFAEDILVVTREDNVEVAVTPSHRSSRHTSGPLSPLVILFGFLYRPPCALAKDECSLPLYKLADKIIELLASSRASSAAKIEILSRSLGTSSTSNTGEAYVGHAARLWTCVASNAVQALKLRAAAPSSHDSPTVVPKLRNAMLVLQHGLAHVSISPEALSQAIELYDAMFADALSGAGTGGSVSAVIEPFARALGEDCTMSLNAKLAFASNVLKTVIWPRNRHELEHARKAFWGISLAPHKATIFDPFDHLYAMAESLLVSSYNKLGEPDGPNWEVTRTYIQSVTEFLAACPRSFLANALSRTQDGIVPWIEDALRKTSTPAAVAAQMKAMWYQVLRLMSALPAKESVLLTALEPLLVAGLSSPHESIVNETIVFWNMNLSSQNEIDYPPKLEKVVRARLADTNTEDLQFPGTIAIGSTTLPDFFETYAEDAGRLAATSGRPVQSKQSNAAKSSNRPSKAVCDLSESVFEQPHQSTPKARLRHDDSQIQFMPVESSPLQSGNGSQLLTEHQREVRTRQQFDAPMFPDMSSSPVGQSTALPRGVQKRLDFRPDARSPRNDQPPDTPRMALPEAEGLVSDDIPSSPTPSSTRATETMFVSNDGTPPRTEPLCDLPSSPPGEESDRKACNIHQTTGLDHHADPDEMIMELVDRNMADVEHAGIQAEVADPVAEISNSPRVAGFDNIPELLSDTNLATVQLQLEEEAAAMTQEHPDASANARQAFDNRDLQTKVCHGEMDEKEDLPLEIAPAPTNSDKHQGARSGEHMTHDIGIRIFAEHGDCANGITRVEDSFIETPVAQIEENETGELEAQQSPRTSRKRKRSPSIVFTAKKRKHRSPLQRFFSSLLPRSQEEDDDDIGDEIVVASSQTFSSPRSDKAHQKTLSPAKLANVKSDPMEASSVPVQKGVVANLPQNRRHGRPAKFEGSTRGMSDAISTQRPTRKASSLSNSDAARAECATSFVTDTPTPSKEEKQRDGRYGAAKVSHDERDTRRITRRSVSAVIVSQPQTLASKAPYTMDGHVHAEVIEDADDDNDTPEKQLATEQRVAAAQRPIATPSSILSRLKSVIMDCGKINLRPQEERDFDDMVFELRKTVHEAGRRGRGG